MVLCLTESSRTPPGMLLVAPQHAALPAGQPEEPTGRRQSPAQKKGQGKRVQNYPDRYPAPRATQVERRAGVREPRCVPEIQGLLLLLPVCSLDSCDLTTCPSLPKPSPWMRKREKKGTTAEASFNSPLEKARQASTAPWPHTAEQRGLLGNLVPGPT